MTTFVIGCTHFGHANIIKLAKRPFDSVEEMDYNLVENWNSVVKPEDTVWHLGDFAWHNPNVFFSKLNGKKNLIIGNHDPDETLRCAWNRIEDTVFEKIDGTWVHMHHYPLAEWQGYFRKAVHLHSHTHGNLPNVPGRMDVGVERMNYTPVPITELCKKAWTT
jgi:calcineurin-like phosphoesterase family protein